MVSMVQSKNVERFLNKIEALTDSIRTLFPPTELQYSSYLSQKYDADIWLKREDQTPVRSYKIRGAFSFISNLLKDYNERKLPRFVCASAGNHSQGVAFVSSHYKCRSIIFMPVTTPQQKIQKTKFFGDKWVEVRQVGDTFDECYAFASKFSKVNNDIFIPPFDHEDVILGQASVAREILHQWPFPNVFDTIIVPVGGGGLAAGVSLCFCALGIKTNIHYAEPSGAASFWHSLRDKKRVRLSLTDPFVDGASVAEMGELNFDILKNTRLENVHIVPENRLCTTLMEFLDAEGIVLEPAGALSIDVLQDIAPEELRKKKIVLIVSGGNFDFERLPDVKERVQKYKQLKKYFVFRFPQRPGALKSLLELLGPDDDISRFEYLKKSARSFGSVLIGIETKSPDNFITLNKKFVSAGWSYRDITDDPILSDLII